MCIRDRYGAEGVDVNLEYVEQPHQPRVVERALDGVLARGVLNVVSLLELVPLRVNLVDLAGHVPVGHIMPPRRHAITPRRVRISSQKR